jgi:hypothetical protein
MTNDQIREVEVILDSIIKANNPVFANEVPLPLAKEVQGLRACFDEVLLYSVPQCILGKVWILNGYCDLEMTIAILNARLPYLEQGLEFETLLYLGGLQ